MVSKNLIRFQRDLLSKQTIGLDTMCFLYHFTDHPAYNEMTTTLFSLIEKGKLKAVTSMMTIAEAFVQVERSGNSEVLHEYELVFTHSPNIEILPVDWHLARLSAKLRANYPKIRIPDALQISAPLLIGYKAFVTNDENLKRVNELEIIVLDDYLDL